MSVYILFALFTLYICAFVISTAESILGTDCQVDISLNQSSKQNHSFDLNQLHSNSSDFKIITENGQVFRINICGSLIKRCSNQDNVSACLMHENGREMVIGRRNDSVVYDNGRLHFELFGDMCQGGKNSSVTIILKCNDAALLHAGPELLPSGSNCTYYFIWYNRFSCTPHKEIECSAMDSKNRIYDLSHLTLHSSNYVAIMKLNQRSPKVRVELNVCHSVILGHDVTCKFDSGVCATDTINSENKTMRNLGDVSSGPYFENEVLKLKYEGGDECLEEDAGGIKTSTIVAFFCDHSKHDSHPTFLKLAQPCQYHFIWNTFAACPIELNMGSDAVIPAEEGEECSAENPITMSSFDLRPLMGRDYEVAINDRQTLQFSVCGSLQNSSCGPNVASCVVESNSTKHWSAGKSKPHPQVNGSPSPFLFYTDGETCSNDLTFRTIILFECATEENEGPKFDSIINCRYVVHWHTHLVCERKIQCVASSASREVDLTALASVDNYNVTVGSKGFLINVCQPLRPVDGSYCYLGSAACMIDSELRHLSLGYLVDSPIIDDRGDTILTYLNGSLCPSSSGRQLSTVIRFVCDPSAGRGGPVFRDTAADGCTYHFDWRTSVACESSDAPLNATGGTADCRAFATVPQLNLTALGKPVRRVWSAPSNKNYSINLCGEAGSCDGAAVCEQTGDSWVSYGEIANVEYDIADNYTKLVYAGGASCDSSGKTFYSAEVWLQCAEEAGVGEPTVLRETDACSVLFEWKTEMACGTVDLPSENMENNSNPKTKYSLHIGVQLAMVAVLGTVCGLYLLWHFKVLKCPKCPRLRNRLSGLFRGEFTQVTYSRQRQEEDDAWGT